MAVTLTEAQLSNALRVDRTNGNLMADVHRVHAAATAMVEKYAPHAPEAIQNQALVVLAGYVFDAPLTEGVRNVLPSMLRNSGAASMLSQWRGHRLGTTGAATGAAPGAGGGGGGGVSSLEIQTLRDQITALGNSLVARITALEGADTVEQSDIDAINASIDAINSHIDLVNAALNTLVPSVQSLTSENPFLAAIGPLSGNNRNVQFVRRDSTTFDLPITNQDPDLANAFTGVSLSGTTLGFVRDAVNGLVEVDLASLATGGALPVQDIGAGLPTPAADQKGKIILDPVHSTGYFIGEDRQAGTDAIGEFRAYSDSDYLGAFVDDTAARGSVLGNPSDLNKFYWNRRFHKFRVWDRVTIGGGENYFWRDIPTGDSSIAAFLAESEGHSHDAANTEVYWLGHGTAVDVLHNLPTIESGITSWRGYAFVEDGDSPGLKKVNSTDYTAPVTAHDVFSWLPIAVPGITAAVPSEVEALAARVAALEGAPAGLTFRVVSRYHNVATHPNDIAGYLGDDSDPIRTYSRGGTADRPSDVVSGDFAPWSSARYVAVQDEGASQPHRLVLPNDATVVHIQLEDYEATGLFFIADLSVLAYAGGGDFANQILYARATSNADERFWAFVGITAARELLIGARSDGPSAAQTAPSGLLYRPPRRVRVRVA